MLGANREAEACGGCFTQTRSATQVTGHRMLLSLSNDATTLYDQIEYTGSPDSFAWVLPIKGIAQIGLSSDLLFSVLDSLSGVTIQSPPFPSCPSQDCGPSSTGFTSSGAGGAGGGYGEEPPVEVLAQQTVGPYETVQLASTDPAALTDWLTSHGYDIPTDVQPLIEDYVSEGFNFLAMKLVPGAGVDAMRPVRITVPGASPALPLRMVAAGTGVTTLVTLWVIAEGRYQPANFPWFVIDESELVWDWSSASSNYKTLRAAGYDASGGLAWLIESASGLSHSSVASAILSAATNDAANSGYDPTNAGQEASADMQALFGSLSPSSTWYTRLRGELSRDAFTDDLLLEAADSQEALPTILDVINAINAPTCPPPPDCNGDGVPDWDGNGSPNGSQAEADAESGGCAARPLLRTTAGWVALPLFGACYLLLRWRRRRMARAGTRSSTPLM